MSFFHCHWKCRILGAFLKGSYLFNIQKVSKFDGFPNKKFCPQAVILFETKACACQNLHIFHNTVVSITSGMKCVLSLAFKKFWFDKVAKKVQNLVKEEK